MVRLFHLSLRMKSIVWPNDTQSAVQAHMLAFPETAASLQSRMAAWRSASMQSLWYRPGVGIDMAVQGTQDGLSISGRIGSGIRSWES